ncbi:hypothetical protein BHE74_00014909 [Ensete ventricosum]|nr:hypothetical protein BHE74_00014909 [Ensete ventricosum]
MIMWYQSGTSTRRNTCHTNVGDLAGLYGGQSARATVWGKRTLRFRERSHSKARASRLGIQRNGQPFTREAPQGQASEEECVAHKDWDEVRGIANSKDSVRMQGLVHGRQSVRAHPKARSKLDAMEHQNFPFNMERIRPCSAKRSNPKGMVVSETSSGKNAKRKVAPTGQISKRDKS